MAEKPATTTSGLPIDWFGHVGFIRDGEHILGTFWHADGLLIAIGASDAAAMAFPAVYAELGRLRAIVEAASAWADEWTENGGPSVAADRRLNAAVDAYRVAKESANA